MAIKEPLMLLIRRSPLCPAEWKSYDYLFLNDDGTCTVLYWYGLRKAWIHIFENGSVEGEVRQVKPALVRKLLKTVKGVKRSENGDWRMGAVRTEGIRIQTLTAKA